MRLLIFGICITVSIAAGACVGGNQNGNVRQANVSNSAQPNAARTNVEELGLLVKIPYETEDVVWKNIGEKTLIAVLRFSNTDADKIVAEAQQYGPAESVTLPLEMWFPEELVAQGEMSGDSALRGVSYPANGFAQEPFTIGRVTRIEGTDFFVLEISAN